MTGSNLSNYRNPTMWYARRDGDSENKDQANQNIKERWGEAEDYIVNQTEPVFLHDYVYIFSRMESYFKERYTMSFFDQTNHYHMIQI